MSGKSQTTLIILFEEELRAMATALKSVHDANEVKDDERLSVSLAQFYSLSLRGLHHLMSAPPGACVVLGRLPRNPEEVAVVTTGSELPAEKQT